ncbi:unnamed protein product, partial [marine sediment metagenome]
MRFTWIALIVLMASPVVSISAPAGGASQAATAPEVRTYGPGVVAVTFVGSFDAEAGKLPASYEIRTPDGQVAVTKVGRASQVRRLIHRGWPYKPVMAHTVFLVLEKPLKPKAACTVTVAKAVTGKALSLRCAFDPAGGAPELIKINQCGYLPDGPKVAFLGGWLGDLGALELKDLAKTFRVLDSAGGREAFTGRCELQIEADPASGES